MVHLLPKTGVFRTPTLLRHRGLTTAVSLGGAWPLVRSYSAATKETRDANSWRRDRAAWTAALGVRVAPVRGHRGPVPLNDASRSALGWTGLRAV
jgi:hypothetical protein